MILIAGPCVIEGHSWLVDVAGQVDEIVKKHSWVDRFYFKSSFDKANRTSRGSYRGIGYTPGLLALHAALEVTNQTITDVHETHQVEEVASIVSALQIPAFLSRQTDLIEEVMSHNVPVNIKRAPWMGPDEALQVYAKAEEAGREYHGDFMNDIWLCDRGSTFGYGNLVTDIPAIVDISKKAPVIFDCTHSIQRPGGHSTHSGGRREMIPFVSRAVAATGVLSGFFMEVHPDPANAKSDAACQLPLHQLDSFLGGLGEILEIS